MHGLTGLQVLAELRIQELLREAERYRMAPRPRSAFARWIERRRRSVAA